MRKRMIAAACLLLLSALLCPAQPNSGACRPSRFAASAESAASAVGLDRLEALDDAEFAALPLAEGPIILESKGVRLPYDAGANTYYLPVASEDDGLPPHAALALPDGLTGYMRRDSDGVQIIAAGNGQCLASRVILTTLPVIDIVTSDGDMPGEADLPGTLSLFEPDSGALRVTQTRIEINLRGNTSRRFPKKSYRVKIVDDFGIKRNLSVAGLRADDDWILNPMYADTSKIREALGYWLWEVVNSCGKAAASSRVRYAEALFNGAYHGLYGVQERVDRKQMDADRQTGVIYKVVANRMPSVDELLACESDNRCRAFELAFSGAGVASPWRSAADYIALLTGVEAPGDARLSMANAIDYALWAMLTQAHDCHFKNQFVHAASQDGGTVLYRAPWDLNNTFGDIYAPDDAAANYTEYRCGRLVRDDVCKLLTDAGDEAFIDLLQRRWHALRDGSITPENILSHARALYQALFSAIDRDAARWPQCGLGEGNARNIRDIEDFINTTIPRMDRWIDSLSMDGAETELEDNGEDMDR